MRGKLIFVVAAGVALAVTVPMQGAQPQAQRGAGAATAPAVPPPIAPPKPFVPDGFTPLFNGQNLDGWHVSKTNHHGTTPDYHVLHGMIVATQSPFGQGGILLTNKKYKNVELYTEVKPDYGCDSGLFFRSNEAGDAYQVTMDYLPGGSIGGIYGEGLEGVGAGAPAATPGAAPAGRGAAVGATGPDRQSAAPPDLAARPGGTGGE